MPTKMVSLAELNQDDTLDMIASGQIQQKQPRRTPLSLQMGETVMIGNAIGNPEARAIADAWQPSFNIVVMPAAEFDELSTRCSTTFHGLAADIG